MSEVKIKYGPGECSSCGCKWDLSKPYIFKDKSEYEKGIIYIYFKCDNTECERIVYTEVNFSELLRVWYSGEIVIKDEVI